MAKHHKPWLTTIEALRLVTPVLLFLCTCLISILSFQFLEFNQSLKENTRAVNDLRTTVAILSENKIYSEVSIKDLNVRVAALEKVNGHNIRYYR